MTSTLKRKLAGDHRGTAANQMTALRALRLSMARAGEDLYALPLAVSGGRQTRHRPDDLGAVLSDDDMLMVLDCLGGMTGAVAVSASLVGALVQQQTIGRVSDRDMPARSFTDTDAALVAPLIEGVLTRACDLAEEEAVQACFRGARFGARADDARTLLLALRAKRYRCFALVVDIALGLHQGQLTFVLPDPAEEARDPEADAQARAARAANSPMLNVPTELRAVLARFRLSVSDLNALSVGDTLPLARDQLDDTALVTITNRVIARGRLGQMNGHRAVRLMATQSVPKAGRPAAFHPQVTAQPQEDPTDSTAPDPVMGGDPPFDLPDGTLADMSTEEAVDEISSLAGLTAEDLAALDAPGSQIAALDTDLPMDFPAVDLDLEDPA